MTNCYSKSTATTQTLRTKRLPLWEFEVKPGSEEQFEKVYGPEGPWARLFQKDGDHLETRLLREVGRERVYVTLDAWRSRQSYETFLEEHATDYKKLDGMGEGLTTREMKIAWLEEPRLTT